MLNKASSQMSIQSEILSATHGGLGHSKRRLWALRILHGILRRVVQRTRLMILRAPRNDFGPPYPEECVLVRVVPTAHSSDQQLAVEAMRAAGEPDGLVAPRLAHGDEFFGWLIGGRVVSFGWVTRQDRTVGPIRLTKASGRAFLYNFFTLEGYRGQRLYPALLLAIRHGLGLERVSDFVIDVDAHNIPSIRGIEKGGFALVAQLAFLTLFARWRCFGSRTLFDRNASSLFRPI